MLNVGKKEIAIAVSYFFLSIALFWPILAGYMPGKGEEAYVQAWEVWWNAYKGKANETAPFTTYVFYPVGEKTSIILLPVYQVASALIAMGMNVNQATGTIFLLGMFFSAVAAYALIYYLTKSRLAAFAGGFLFAFSPIHSLQGMGLLQYSNIEFLPLSLLFIIKLANEKKKKYAIYSGIALAFSSIFGGGALFTINLLCILVFAIYLAISIAKKQAFEKEFAKWVGVILAIGIIASLPVMLIQNSLDNSYLQFTNRTAYAQANSANFLSFFDPSTTNQLLGGIADKEIYLQNEANTVAYLGYTAIAVSAYALYNDRRKKEPNALPFLVTFLLSLWLSLGPYLSIGSVNTEIPGIYLLYEHLPIISNVLKPEKFGLLSSLMLAVLFSYGIKDLQNTKGLENKSKYYLIGFILLLAFAEYMPAVANPAKSGAYSSIPIAYYELGKVPGKSTILMLPATPDIWTENLSMRYYYPSLELYYQTALEKPIIGGYSQQENASQWFSLENIPLVVSASYLQAGQGLVYLSPIIENYTNASKLLLYLYNTTFIVVIRKAYTTNELDLLLSYLVSTFGNPVYEDNSTVVFSTARAIEAMHNVTTAYTPVMVYSNASVWNPGWSICNDCNASFNNAWWGAYPAFIEIYAERPETLTASMKIMANAPNSKITLFFDGKQVSNLTLNESPVNFSIALNATQGINPLVFLPVNRTQMIALENFTISKNGK